VAGGGRGRSTGRSLRRERGGPPARRLASRQPPHRRAGDRRESASGPDHVLEEMLRGLGATLTAIRGAVRPRARRVWTCAGHDAWRVRSAPGATPAPSPLPRAGKVDIRARARMSGRGPVDAPEHAEGPPHRLRPMALAPSRDSKSRWLRRKVRAGGHPLPNPPRRGGNRLEFCARHRPLSADAWLSPSFPGRRLCVFERPDGQSKPATSAMRETLRRWLTVMLTSGGGFCDAVLFAHAARAILEADDDALRATASSPPRCRRRRNAFSRPPRKVRPSLLPRVRVVVSALDRLAPSGMERWPIRSRSASRLQGNGIAPEARCTRTCMQSGKPDLGRRASRAARADRRPAPSRRAPSRWCAPVRSARSRPGSTKIGSAAFRADLAACITSGNTRGCSGRECCGEQSPER